MKRGSKQRTAQAVGRRGRTGCSPYRTPEHRKWIRDRNKEYALDRKEAAEIERMGIVKYPMDLPSLHRAVIYGNRARAVGVFTTGYDWLDKPHRVAFSAIEEVRALRKFILANPTGQRTGGIE